METENHVNVDCVHHKPALQLSCGFGCGKIEQHAVSCFFLGAGSWVVLGNCSQCSKDLDVVPNFLTSGLVNNYNILRSMVKAHNHGKESR